MWLSGYLHDMATPVGPQHTSTPDGRRARRERGRAAVTEATLSLIMESGTPPTADDAASRAGVSAASVFRYFDSLDELRDSTSDLFIERYASLMQIPNLGRGTRRERIDSYLAARLRMYETTANVLRLLRYRAFDVEAAQVAQKKLRLAARDRIRRHFHQEISELPSGQGEQLVAVIATATSFDAWDQMHTDHGMAPNQLRRAWSLALERVLEP